MTEKPGKPQNKVDNSKIREALKQIPPESIEISVNLPEEAIQWLLLYRLLKKDALNLLKMNITLYDELVMSVERIQNAIATLEEYRAEESNTASHLTGWNLEAVAETKAILKLTLTHLEAISAWADSQPLSQYLASEIGVLNDE